MHRAPTGPSGDRQNPARPPPGPAGDGAAVPPVAGAQYPLSQVAPLSVLRPLRVSHHLSHDRAVLASRVRSGHHRLAVITAMHGAALLTPQPTPLILKASDMAAFSVFFCDQERCSIQPVRAMDPDHAIAQVRRQVPDLRRVAVVPDELLEGVDPLQLLEEWIQAKG